RRWYVRVRRRAVTWLAHHRPGRAGRPRSQGTPSSRAAPLTLLALAVLLALGLGCVGLAATLPGATRHGTTIGPALGRPVVMSCMSGLAVLVAARVPRP